MADIIINGGLELWASDTDLTGWEEYISGTSTINRESTVVHGGTYSCRFDVDASDSSVYIRHIADVLLTPGAKYRLSLWYKNSASNKTSRIHFYDSGTNVGLKSDATWDIASTRITLVNSMDWKNYIIDFNAHASYSNYWFYLQREAAASSSIYFDDVSIQEIPVINLIHTRFTG